MYLIPATIIFLVVLVAVSIMWSVDYRKRQALEDEVAMRHIVDERLFLVCGVQRDADVWARRHRINGRTVIPITRPDALIGRQLRINQPVLFDQGWDRHLSTEERTQVLDEVRFLQLMAP